MKRHLNPATAIACIALFVALSGAAVAAKTSLRNGAVTTPKIRNGAVTTAKLRNGAVVNKKLRNGSVTGAKIAAGTIGSGQLGKGSVRAEQLGGQVVTEGKIKNGAVTNNKLGTESVATGKLSNEAVTAAKISADFYGQLVKNVSYTNALSAETDEDEKSITAECPSGREAIGGGVRVNGELKEISITGSNPFAAGDGKRTGWSGYARESPVEAGATKWSIEAFAVCAEL